MFGFTSQPQSATNGYLARMSAGRPFGRQLPVDLSGSWSMH